MALYIKILLCFGILLESIVCLRYEELVRFNCRFCKPQPNACCVGTIIYKDMVLTTSNCAQSCQFIVHKKRKVSIDKTFSRTDFDKQERTLPVRSDVALVSARLDLGTNKYVKLSAVDTLSVIGRKAMFPVFDGRQARMRFIILNKCHNRQLRMHGYHICGVKAMNRDLPKSCFKTEGVPLLLDNKILGMSSAVDKHLCNREQTYFTAIGPDISWIRSITEKNKKTVKLNYENKRKFNMEVTNSTVPVETTKNLTYSTHESKTATVNKPQSSIKIISNNITERKSFEPSANTLKTSGVSSRSATSSSSSKSTTMHIVSITTNTPLPITSSFHTTSSIYQTTTRTLPTTTLTLPTTTRTLPITTQTLSTITRTLPTTTQILSTTTRTLPTTTSTLSTTTRTSPTTSILSTTAITLPTTTITLPTTTLTSITATQSTSTATSTTTLSSSIAPTSELATTIVAITPATTTNKPTTTSPTTVFTTLTTVSTTERVTTEKQVQKSTSALDWFNANVRNKLRQGSQYFILTTDQTKFETPFVDLTM